MYRPSIGALIALIGILILAACSDSPAVQATAVPPSSTPLVESARTATALPFRSEPIIFPEYPCCRGTNLEAGVYRTPDWFAIAFQLTLDDGWRGMGERADKSIWIVQGGLSRANKWIGWIPIPSDKFAEVAWSELRATPGLITGEDMDIVIGGLSGKQFDAVTDPETEHKFEGAHVELPTMKQIMDPDGAGTFVTETLNTSLQFILLPVAGRHMIIYIEAPNDEFAEFAAQAKKVLQTVQFEDQ